MHLEALLSQEDRRQEAWIQWSGQGELASLQMPTVCQTFFDDISSSTTNKDPRCKAREL